VLAQVFSKVFIISEFYLHKEYIAKNLCENRDKPESRWQGKCHLSKKLSDDENHELPSSTKNVKEKQDIQLFYDPFRVNFCLHEPVTNEARFYCYNDLTILARVSSIFHPPSV